MRNNLIHEYCEVNLDFVWETSSNEVGLLVEKAKAMLLEPDLPEELRCPPLPLMAREQPPAAGFGIIAP